jgi:tetratricopeptide (TPR) repeat protein
LPKDEEAAAAVRPPPREKPRQPTLSSFFDHADDGFDAASNRPLDLIDEGKLDEAEAAANDLLRDYPDVADGLWRLAAVYEARDDKKRAADYWRKAVVFMQQNEGYAEELIVGMRQKADKLDPPLSD